MQTGFRFGFVGKQKRAICKDISPSVDVDTCEFQNISESYVTASVKSHSIILNSPSLCSILDGPEISQHCII